MDILFHGLTGLVIGKAVTGKYLVAASVFAMIPDLIGVVPFEYLKFQKANKASIELFVKDWLKYTQKNRFWWRGDKLGYRLAHSLVLAPLLTFIALIFFNDIWFLLLACYLSHFLVDIPLHTEDFAFRPFWPFSDFYLGGKSWTRNSKIFLGLWLILGVIFLALI